MAKKKLRNNRYHENPRQDALDAAWEKFRPFIPESELPAMEAALSKPLDRAFRLNPLKLDRREIEILAKRYGWILEQVPFCTDGFRIRACQTSPSLTREHQIGQYYIQDTASMLPASLFDTRLMESCPLILDMAASPGGKTTHLAARSLDQGLIMANDSSLSRISALKTVLKNWGSLNHFITNFPGENYGLWYPDTFDIILLDAPCSMQSLVSIDSHPMRPITEREEKALALRQTALLDSAIHALRPGGQLVYSTCTLSPYEDEAVVNQILQKYGSKISVANAQERLPYPAPGLTSDGTQAFDPSLTGSIRLWPHRYETAGFFAALICKLDSFSDRRSEIPFRSWEKSGFAEMNMAMQEKIDAFFDDQFAFLLKPVMEKYDCSLWQRENEVWALPNRYVNEFSSLPCKSAGMKVATLAASGWIPDNDWMSRFFRDMKKNRCPLDDDQAARWLHGEDLPSAGENFPKGTILLMVDACETYLGCGFVSSGRIRNLSK